MTKINKNPNKVLPIILNMQKTYIDNFDKVTKVDNQRK